MSLSLNRQPNSQWLEGKPPRDFITKDIYVGGGDQQLALHVATAEFTGSGEPTAAQLKDLHKRRTGNGVTPVVLVVEVDSRHCVVFGHNADWAPTRKIEYSTVARILQAALDDPNPIAARERINTFRDALDTTSLPGIKNSGLFANHELATGVPTRPDFDKACQRSVALLSLTGTPLLNGLGFAHTAAGNNAYLLRGTGKDDLAVAVMLQDDEMFDAPSKRLDGLPVAKGLAVAEVHGVSWIILLRRTKIRLYPAQLGLGVGRKGLTETYLEIDLPQLTDANAGYLSLIFSVDALVEGGTAYDIMESSRQYAVGLGERLREKVYEEIIPLLSVAVAKSVKGRKQSFTPDMLSRAYDLTLRIFFRILFQVYAEDRKLLPLGENPGFDKLALKTLARKLAADRDLYKDADGTELWEQLAKVWKAVDEGSAELGIPAYNGGLFSNDQELHPESAAIADLTITDDIMGPVLRALLLDIGDAGDPVPIDFRSLGVREFGTIYEGLLESSLGVAETDLTLDKDKNWVPAKKKSDEIFAPAGSVYFHNTSGQRKGTGSYFTPSFVVEHLLERSLDPALDSHLASVAELVASGNDAAATEKFFDFRVADIAMGSGHFLTAAIDHIEKKLAAFLVNPEHPMPGVLKEIIELEAAARAAIGPDGPEINRSSLLRRQIARRCIYGLDLNPIAVELSRVSIWIHTFVRGLPMSSLDHNLVCGNSLTGIGTIDEALDVLVPTRLGKGKGKKLDKTNITFEEMLIEQVLGEARETLLGAAQSLELDKSQSRAAAKAAKKARAQAVKAMRLFDAAVLRRIGREGLVAAEEIDEVIRLAGDDAAQNAIAGLAVIHFPAVFPEVFLRERGGFDVLVGNPPWDKVEHDRQIFLTRHIPGFKGISNQAERDRLAEKFFHQNPIRLVEFEGESKIRTEIRQVLVEGPYPGMGVDHPDLAKAFAWRNRQLLSATGALSLVLPRVVLSGRALCEWRRSLFSEFQRSELVLLSNGGNYVFENVDTRKEFVLVSAHKVSCHPGNLFGGPHRTKSSWDAARSELADLDLRTLGELGEIPQIPSTRSASLLRKFFGSPRFSDSQYFMQSVYETDATKDKKNFVLKGSPGRGEIAVYKGESIDLWNSDTGKYFAVASETRIGSSLLERARALRNKSNSAFFGFDGNLSDLPFRRPRIAYRWTTNSTNRRTMIVALVPPSVILTNGIPYLYSAEVKPQHEAFLLGVFSSLPFDWLVRRYVEGTMRQGLLNALPIPDIDVSSSVGQEIIALVHELVSDDARLREWKESLGVIPSAPRVKALRDSSLAALDAVVADAYGLTRGDLQEILETFHSGDGDHQVRRDLIFDAFDLRSRK
jgi:hypothetical protein